MRASLKPTLLLVVTCMFCSASSAQESELRERFMMLNQWQCPYGNLSNATELSETQMAPILDAMLEDGEIDDWGFLTHNWGDEWNFNWYMVTDDHRGFLEAWDGFLSRINEAEPEFLNQFLALCPTHKDNLYVLRDSE